MNLVSVSIHIAGSQAGSQEARQAGSLAAWQPGSQAARQPDSLAVQSGSLAVQPDSQSLAEQPDGQAAGEGAWSPKPRPGASSLPQLAYIITLLLCNASQRLGALGLQHVDWPCLQVG